MSIAKVERPSRMPLLRWFLAWLAVASAGTYLAYRFCPLSSDAWRCWAGPRAWIRDVLRVLIAGALAVFCLWNLRVSIPKTSRRGRHSWIFPLKSFEWGIVAIVLFFLLVVNFRWLPRSLESDWDLRAISQPVIKQRNPDTLGKVSDKTSPTGSGAAVEETKDKFFVNNYTQYDCKDSIPCDPRVIEKAIKDDRFRQIFRPYFPYLGYTSGLWIGIAFPVLLFLIRGALEDRAASAERWSRLDRAAAAAESSTPLPDIHTFEELFVSFQNHVAGLKAISERYVPVLLAISITLIYEQLTPSHETATPQAVDSAKIALWAILGPAAAFCISMAAVGYQRASRMTSHALQALSETLAKHSGSDGLSDKVRDSRDKILWDQSPLGFVLSVSKSATISIPLLLAIIGYVLTSLGGPGGWIGIFVPERVIHFIKQLYS